MNWRYPLLCLAAGSACRAAQAVRTSQEPPRIPVVRFRNEATAFSAYSGIEGSLHAVVRDSMAWTELWRRINQPFFPKPAPPRVDFAREMVVVAALGSRPSAGYDVVIERASATPEGMIVDLQVSNPAPGCPVAAVMTQPVDLGRIPLTDGPVVFREHDVRVPCDRR